MSKYHAKPLMRYSGTIKVAGITFDYETTAVSEAEAKNNGIAQCSRRVNMSIGKLRKYMKDYSAQHEVVLMESHHEEQRV